jgi:23S rRNA pseudouridine2605 synthase
MGISVKVIEMERRNENRDWKRPQKGDFNKEKREERKPFSKKFERDSEQAPREFKRKRIQSFEKAERFSDKKEKFSDKRERFSDKKERFSDKRERFSRKEKTFDREPKRFERERNTYSEKPTKSFDKDIRLNRFIANSGVCSRREADVLIASGAVTVNGKVVTQMGVKVSTADVVCYDGERLSHEKKVYLLLNKPKGFITTLDDPQERKTVMSLVEKACTERIYPVGRLDRNTTGLLLFTNDGDMTKKLTHPSFGARKIYHVELNKPLTRNDMQSLLDGIELEDGFARFDDIQFVEYYNDKKVVGVELHSGKNRIVRRMFEAMGYYVEKLDRVSFAGLTKKDLPRGRCRFLTEKEINFLKML